MKPDPTFPAAASSGAAVQHTTSEYLRGWLAGRDAAAALVEQNAEVFDVRGKTLQPRTQGDLQGSGYAAAIRALTPPSAATAVTVQEAARVLLRAGGLTEKALLAAHNQIDWHRDGQMTESPYDPSQTCGGGTSCAQDVQDAWLAALRALSEGDKP